MKKNCIILVLLAAFAMPASAQNFEKSRKDKHPEISEMVTNLSSSQKRKLETVSSQSKTRVVAMRKSLKAVRDSIGMYMEYEGDQSAVLFPLFDREAKLQAAISREMYSTRLLVDEILTKEQRAELKQNTQRAHKNKKKQ